MHFIVARKPALACIASAVALTRWLRPGMVGAMNADDCAGGNRHEADGSTADGAGAIDVHQPHDKLFKIAFSNIEAAAKFFKWRMEPALAGAVDWASLKLEAGSFIDSHLRSSEADLLFSAQMAGEQVLLYCLAEHLSTPEEFVSVKLLRYKARIYERQAATLRAGGGRLSPVFAFVIAQFDEGSGTPPRLIELFDLPGPGTLRESCERRIPDFDFDVLHLARTGYDEIDGSPGGILALRLLKAERAGDLLADEVWDEALILRVPREFFEVMLRYLLARDVDTAGFEAKLNALQQPSLRTTAMTLAEKLMQKGRQEGRQQGHQEGHQEGRQEGLQTGLRKGLRQGRQDDILEALELRFGQVPVGLAEEVRLVDDNDKLRSLLRAAIQCANLEAFASEL